MATIRAYVPELSLFAAIYLFSVVAPVSTSFDSQWSVPIMLSLVQRGTLNLDTYQQQIREKHGAGAICVDSAGNMFGGYGVGPLPKCEGHWYSWYPVSGPLYSIPVLLPPIAILRSLGRDPFRFRFLLEIHASSAWVAASAVLVFRVGARYLTPLRALLLALIFALGTSAFSTGTRALWQHTPSMFLLLCAVYLLISAEERPSLAGWAGLPLAMSYTVRPSNAVLVAVLTVFVYIRFRAQFPRFLFAALPVAALFVTLNESMYHRILPPYFIAQANTDAPNYLSGVAEAGLGLLISPSRGLFVFTPVFLFAVYAMVRNHWQAPLAPWLSVGMATSIVLMTFFLGPRSLPGKWWGGHCYGPRLLTDFTPILTLFLIPILQSWNSLGRVARAIFITFVFAGILIHVHCGWSDAGIRWNSVPVNVDQHPERLWDWKDPQFLR